MLAFVFLLSLVAHTFASEFEHCRPGGLCELSGCSSDSCCDCAQCACDGSDITVEEPLGFSYSQCGGSGATLHALTVSPDPIKLGQNITVKAAWNINQAGTSISLTQVALHIDKKVLGVWVEVPCVDNLGSCTYQNVCGLLDQGHICNILGPLGIPCKCPITVGSYSLGAKGISALVKDPNLSWLTNGDFYVKASVGTASNVYFCIELYLSIST